MSDVRIALYRGVSALSRMIRWATRGPYSHAALLLDDGSVIEAWRRGVCRARPFAHHLPGTQIDVFAFRRPLADAEAGKIIDAALGQLGKPYDWTNIFRSLSRRSTVWNEAWFCSELVAWACAGAGRPLLIAEPSIITPHHISWSTELEHAGTLTRSAERGRIVVWQEDAWI